MLPTENPDIGKELAEIKRLLIFMLLKMGASQTEIGKALGTSQASISRMIGKVEPWTK